MSEEYCTYDSGISLQHLCVKGFFRILFYGSTQRLYHANKFFHFNTIALAVALDMVFIYLLCFSERTFCFPTNIDLKAYL